VQGGPDDLSELPFADRLDVPPRVASHFAEDFPRSCRVIDEQNRFSAALLVSRGLIPLTSFLHGKIVGYDLSGIHCTGSRQKGERGDWLDFGNPPAAGQVRR
jgi:hypothetical protein